MDGWNIKKQKLRRYCTFTAISESTHISLQICSPERVMPNSTNVVHLCRRSRALVPKGIFGFIVDGVVT